MTCAATPVTGFVSSLTVYLDCQAQTLGSGSWQALAMPGSTLTVVLTGFLTLFIALIGYNLLLGQGMTVRSGTLAFVKIGAVLALATSWPAYRTLVYDLVVDGPGQVVAEIGPQGGVVGSDGTLLERLDLADQALARLAVLGPGTIVADARDLQLAPPPMAGFDAFALGGSRILFLLTVIAGLAAVRIVAGLMLALGPFFIAFLMFDSTRSLFEGWVRVLAGAALAAIGVSITLGLELALLEPWLSGVLARRMAGEALPTLPTELFVIACLFTVLVLAALAGCMRLARAFRLAPVMHLLPFGEGGAARAGGAATAERSTRASVADGERSRAAAVASVLAAATRMETFRADPGFGTGASATRIPALTGASVEAARSATPIGRSFTRRRPGARMSASAAKRDLKA